MIITNINIRLKDGSSLLMETQELISDGNAIDLFESDSDTLDSKPGLFESLMEHIESSDLVIMRISGDTFLFKRYQEFIEKVESTDTSMLMVYTTPDRSVPYRYLFKGTDDEYDLLMAYANLGGYRNNLNILRWALNRFDGCSFELDEPYRPPAQGVYYPGRESTDIDQYISELDRDRPCIGILMGQRKWNSGKLEPVDALIREIESMGGSVLPIFMIYAENKATGSIGIRGIVDNHLLDADGKPVIDFLINTISSSITMEAKLRASDPDDPFLERLGVPVMQTPSLVSSEAEWRSSTYGLTTPEIAYDVAFPEFDGQIISIPNCSSETDEFGRHYYSPLSNRIHAVADMAMMWAKLRHIPNPEKKIGVIFYMYPPSTSHAGGAADLDTFQSVRELLERLSAEGYSIDWIPETSKELVERILEGITNDTEWVSDDDILKRAADMIPKDLYAEWFDTLSKEQQEFIKRDWGTPPGEVLTVNDEMAVPGIINGNVLLSFQPNRGKDIQAAYHNHNCSIPHQYLGFYRWLRYSFGADAIIHVGTHGTLEWLPGKGVGLSEDCSPDYVMSALPNLYPYVIGNPGEGTQAKRRSYAVLVDHMIPAMVRAGGYEDVEELEAILQTYMKSESMGQIEQLKVIGDELYSTFTRMNLFSDMKLSEDASKEDVCALADELYDYVLEFKGNIIKDGLHVLGLVPDDERMCEMLYSLTRLRNDEIPSLPISISNSLSYDFMELHENPSKIDEATGRFYGEIIDDVEERAFNLISLMNDNGFNLEKCSELASELYSGNEDVASVVRFICEEVHPNILRIAEEMDSLVSGLNGEYILPGPSGCPTRGRARILPTGRNFYTVDPESIPTPASWELGKRMADQMVNRYLDEKGTYPDSVAIVLWATDTMKTGGDDVAYVLSLLGLRPVWAGYGNKVIRLEVIPPEELNRPRIDVTLNISGLFRDTFPNLTEMVDEAVHIVARLEESDEENLIRKHTREDMMALMESGITEDEARRRSMLRVFSTCPGQYGAGVNYLISTSNWKDRNDLGSYYCEVGSYAYGKDVCGEKQTESYCRRLSRTKVTVKNSTSREYDLFDNDDVFQYLGGLNSAVEYVTGSKPMSFIGCSADTSNPVLRTIEEESHYVFRSKVLNPKYEMGLRRHGFRGASEILKMFEYIYGWDATSDIIEDWMYDDLAKHYLIDDEVRGWMEEANPYSIRDMIDVLMEAADRGMWKPGEGIMEKLKDIYVENEELLEEITDKK